MEYGTFIPPLANTWKFVKRAEQLGYSRAWFWDSHMLNSELFVSMTAAAMNTSTIRLASGVMMPQNRIAPVAASGLASLNALAPGRIDWGISTGFTGRRTMGLGPAKLADMEDYIRVVQALLKGEMVEWTSEEGPRKVRFLDPDIGGINIKDPIPLHISAFGPKGQALAARLGAGWINAPASAAHGKAGIESMQASWREAGRDPATLFSSGTIGGCVLKEGESYDSPRVMKQAGAHAMLGLHSLVEAAEFGDIKRPVPAHLKALVERYRSEVYEKYQPADARYLSNHRGHLLYLKPEEQHLCNGELIKATTWTATKPELVERIRELKHAGYNHIGINAGFGQPERLEEWAEVFEAV